MGSLYYSAESLSAATYDLVEYALAGPVGPDVPLYLEILGAAPLTCLEVGCGTGRLAFALAAKGHAVHGLDCSEGMLAIGRRKHAALSAEIRARVSLEKGDARSYELGTAFDVVLISFFCLNHLADVDDWVTALSVAKRHLRPGGRLIVHVLGEGFLEQPVSADRLLRERMTIQLGGEPARLMFSVARREIDAGRGRFRQLNRFQIVDADGVILRESQEWLEFLWLTPDAFVTLAAIAGLTNIGRHTLATPTTGRSDVYVLTP